MLTLAVEQSALAFALVFGGSILMLLLGTQILNWYWLVLLAGTGAGVAFSHIWRSRMAPYRVAQVLDQRFQLSDSLSTAWFLGSSVNHRQNPVAQFQIARAEELSQSLRPEDAFPFTRGRAWALTAALAAVAFGLFAVRYIVTSSLSLRQSLIPIHLESVFERSQEKHSAEGHRALDSSRNEQNANVFSPLARENAPRRDGSQPQDGKENSTDGTAGSSSALQSTDPQANRRPQEGSSEAREGGRPGSEAKSGDKASESPGQEPGSKASAAKDQAAGEKNTPAGLMDKMKDALSSLMAKMRPGQTHGTPQDSKRQNGDAKSGDPNSGSKDQAGQQQNAGNQQASQDQNSTGQAQGETKEKAQASEGQSSDQSPESGSDAKSGVGSQDGNKGVKEADQLQAMGKLEEIIGQRSANLTGEMTVETPSNKQQLKTEYSQRQGHHSDLGGEINRDEVPLMYQQYVREYMEQVRKQGNKGQ